MKSLFTLIALTLFVPLLQAQPINSLLLDDFISGPVTAPDTVLDNQGVWASLFTGSSVLGNHRIVGNYMTETLSSTPLSSTNVSAGVFSVNNNALHRSVGQVIWQGSNITPGGSSIIAHPVSFDLGDVNFDVLLSSPNFNFQWSVINADDRNWEYTVRAYTDNAQNYFEAAIASDQSGVTLSLPRSSFTAVGNPDWSNIDAVSFSATHSDGLLGGDLAIRSVMVAVPEVSSWLLIGAVVGFVVGSYLFRKKQTSDSSIQAASPGLNCHLCGKAFFNPKKHREFCLGRAFVEKDCTPPPPGPGWAKRLLEIQAMPKVKK